MNAASLAPAVWTYPLVIAAGIGLPLLMAAVPLLRTSRTTVRAALDHTGASPPPPEPAWTPGSADCAAWTGAC